MTKSTLMSYLTGIAFFVMTWTTAMAHVSHIEPQAARNQRTCVPGESPEFCNSDSPAGSPEEDFSYEHPFVMAPTYFVDFFIHEDEHHEGEEEEGEEGHEAEEEEVFTPGLGTNIEISKAIHAYLSPARNFSNCDPTQRVCAQPSQFDGDVPGDVDWYRFVLDNDESGGDRENPLDPDANNDLGFPARQPPGAPNTPFIEAGTALVSASALPWRCDAYKTSLPTIALIGPSDSVMDNRASVLPLPDEVLAVLDEHEEWSIFVRENDDPSPFPRSSSDFASGINTDWWGGSPNIMFSDFVFRGFPQQAAVDTVGTYHIVVWDPNGNALDYTLSTGFYEQPTEKEDTVGDANRLLFDNDMLLDIQCQDPCDGLEDGLTSQDELDDIADPEAGICAGIRDV